MIAPIQNKAIGIAMIEFREKPPGLPLQTMKTIRMDEATVVVVEYFLMPKYSGIMSMKLAATAFMRRAVACRPTAPIVSVASMNSLERFTAGMRRLTSRLVSTMEQCEGHPHDIHQNFRHVDSFRDSPENEALDQGGPDGIGTANVRPPSRTSPASRISSSASPPLPFALRAQPFGADRIAAADRAGKPLSSLGFDTEASVVLTYMTHNAGNTSFG